MAVAVDVCCRAPTCTRQAFIGEQVAPLFGNTHTTTSVTGAQTTCFRHEARQIIAQAVNAKVYMCVRVACVQISTLRHVRFWLDSNKGVLAPSEGTKSG